MSNPDSAQIRDLLRAAKTIAVVGLSPDPSRTSFGVTNYMKRAGYKIFGVRPSPPPTILGEPCVAKLAAIPAHVDIINVFRNSEALPELVDEIGEWMKTLSDPPTVLWLQEGVTHESAEKKAASLGLTVIADACILKYHSRLIGS